LGILHHGYLFLFFFAQQVAQFIGIPGSTMT